MSVASSYLNKILTPVAEYTNKTIDNISKKIDESDNVHLKKAKEITKATT